MPANITVRLRGVEDALAGFSRRLELNILDALDECAALVANDAKLGHPKVLPASTAGTAYAGVVRSQGRMAAEDAWRVINPDGTMRYLSRTGNLTISILPERAQRISNGYQAKVVSGMEYSDHVEFGSVRTRPFPFMRPALEKNREEFLRRLTAAVERGIGS